jgi:hypothetical protein
MSHKLLDHLSDETLAELHARGLLRTALYHEEMQRRIGLPRIAAIARAFNSAVEACKPWERNEERMIARIDASRAA